MNIQRAVRWLLLSSFLSLGLGLAMAQSEPTMNEIYSTAQSGKLDQAQVMVQQVLVAHPNSAKAHFVQSELYARQGNLSRAREALASAEKLAPGLPFAKPEAVQALRTQLAAKPVASNAAAPVQYAGNANTGSGSSGWLLPVLLAGGVIVAAYFVFRRKAQPQVYEQPVYNNGLSGPQAFGNGGTAMQPGYGPYGPAGGPVYGQPQSSGLGGRIMGGVATGLAVGAGVVAAEAIGRNLMGGHENAPRAADSFGNQDFQSSPVNTDMGGQNFGINDTSSWDDAGTSDMGGGGGSDWDN
jgi:hypothetical protein